MEEAPWNPDRADLLPTRKSLPKIPGAPDGAAWFWGKDDNLGRLNLLTPARVKEAAGEIRTGEVVTVNLPLHTPSPPVFGREPFRHEIKALVPRISYDDVYHLNTQSGTQWDGFRHCGHFSAKVFYNGRTSDDFLGPKANGTLNGIHHFAQKGIIGRALLLDVWSYCQAHNIKYSPVEAFAISYDLLRKTGEAQGIDIRPQRQGGQIPPGTILLVRAGFNAVYNTFSTQEKHDLGTRPQEFGPDDPTRFAGVGQSEETLDWLHDCYFAAVAGDAPSFECWPARAEAGYYLHEYLLAMWGCPIGEMFDLEGVGEKCREKGKWFFWFGSVTGNCIGGVGGHVNGMAVF